MSSTRRLLLAHGLPLIAAFGVLQWASGQIFCAAPPMPDTVVTATRERHLYPRRYRNWPPGTERVGDAGATLACERRRHGQRARHLHRQLAHRAADRQCAGAGTDTCSRRHCESQWRGAAPDCLCVWDTRALDVSLPAFNIHLAGMAALTLLPLGTMPLRAMLGHGCRYARPAEFTQRPIIELLIWMHVPGATVRSIGALLLCWFVSRLRVAPRRETMGAVESGRVDA